MKSEDIIKKYLLFISILLFAIGLLLCIRLAPQSKIYTVPIFLILLSIEFFLYIFFKDLFELMYSILFTIYQFLKYSNEQKKDVVLEIWEYIIFNRMSFLAFIYWGVIGYLINNDNLFQKDILDFLIKNINAFGTTNIYVYTLIAQINATFIGFFLIIISISYFNQKFKIGYGTLILIFFNTVLMIENIASCIKGMFYADMVNSIDLMSLILLREGIILITLTLTLLAIYQIIAKEILDL
jgi:hypothetical protein